MLTTLVANWWRVSRAALACGTAAGLLWGWLTAATVTPREWLVWDQAAGVVYSYTGAAADPPAAQPEAEFFSEYTSVRVQATVLLLLVVGWAGWATWQHPRIRPRGQAQPPLWLGFDWYVIGLCLGGLVSVALFVALDLDRGFKGPGLTLAAWLSGALDVLLPLYMGPAVFLVWFRRLKSVRAPDWETHNPKPRRRQPGERPGWWPRRKRGGEPPPG